MPIKLTLEQILITLRERWGGITLVADVNGDWRVTNFERWPWVQYQGRTPMSAVVQAYRAGGKAGPNL